MKPEHKKGKSANKSRNPKKRANRFTSGELVFQPWFLPKQSRLAINSLIPPGYRNKMRAYFDDYGCMVCGAEQVGYEVNGMCRPCHQTIVRRLKGCVRRRMAGKSYDRADQFMLRRAKLAKKLLGRFSPNSSARSLRHPLDKPLSNNPIDDALALLSPVIPRNNIQIPVPESPYEGGKSVCDLRTGRPHR
jgi:hypothetical protein